MCRRLRSDGPTNACRTPQSRGAAYFDYLWGFTLGDWFVRWIKAKDLLVHATRKDRGLSPSDR